MFYISGFIPFDGIVEKPCAEHHESTVGEMHPLTCERRVTLAAVTIVSAVDYIVPSSANFMCLPMIFLNMSKMNRLKRSGDMN